MTDEAAATMRNDLWAESVGIPEYVCHKRVRAAKIAAMLNAIDGSSVTLQLGEDAQPWVATPEWFRKHTPEVGGYIVFYADGYVSYSPAKAFEEGYQLGATISSGPPVAAPDAQ